MRAALICTLLFTGVRFALGGTNGVLSLSHYDEIRPDFAGLRTEGIEAIIHEATYPTERDARYASRQTAASRAGLLWGAYHFGNATDGKRQADRFLDFVGQRRNSPSNARVLLILDVEQNNHYPGGTMQVQHALEFINRVRQRTGSYPGLYSNENWIKRLFNSPNVDAVSKETFSKCWLWIANYHSSPWPPRLGTSGCSGNTPAMGFATCHAAGSRRTWPIFGMSSAPCLAAAARA